MVSDKVTLAHGAGGKLSQELMEEVILPAYGNPLLNELHDGAQVPLPPIRMSCSRSSSQAAILANWQSAGRLMTFP